MLLQVPKISRKLPARELWPVPAATTGPARGAAGGSGVRSQPADSPDEAADEAADEAGVWEGAQEDVDAMEDLADMWDAESEEDAARPSLGVLLRAAAERHPEHFPFGLLMDAIEVRQPRVRLPRSNILVEQETEVAYDMPNPGHNEPDDELFSHDFFMELFAPSYLRGLVEHARRHERAAQREALGLPTDYLTDSDEEPTSGEAVGEASGEAVGEAVGDATGEPERKARWLSARRLTRSQRQLVLRSIDGKAIALTIFHENGCANVEAVKAAALVLHRRLYDGVEIEVRCLIAPHTQLITPPPQLHYPLLC